MRRGLGTHTFIMVYREEDNILIQIDEEKNIFGFFKNISKCIKNKLTQPTLELRLTCKYAFLCISVHNIIKSS